MSIKPKLYTEIFINIKLKNQYFLSRDIFKYQEYIEVSLDF
jgi:hypothetical protein